MGSQNGLPSLGRLARESDTYRALRDELNQAEIALRDQRERVAELRRKLPMDTEVEDYALEEGPADLKVNGPNRKVRISEMFDHADKSVVLYHFMYGRKQEAPCPMCSLMVDGLAGISRHIGQVLNFALVAEAEVGALREVARGRGWDGLRLLSSAGSSFKTDFGFQDEAGAQYPGVTVFARDGGGQLRHAYSGTAVFGADGFRGLDLLMPFWHLLDLTPEGRGEFWPKFTYE